MPDRDVSIDRLVFHLNTLAELGEEIASPKDFARIVKSSLFMVMGSFSSSRGIILNYDITRGDFSVIASRGVPGAGGFRTAIDDVHMKALAAAGRPIDLKDREAAGEVFGPLRERLEAMEMRLAVPLVERDEVLGILAVGEKVSGDFTDYDLRILYVMARHVAHSLHSQLLFSRLVQRYNENRSLYESLSRVYYDTIHAFATAIDAKDAYTKGHSHRVSAYCAALAAEMAQSGDEVEGLRIAGLLHDIGKIAVDKSIINKASPLTSLECRELNSHPVVGYEILSRIKFPWQGIPLTTRGHHEKVDGTGYPDRLEGDEIPLGARMMALVDAFDAMTTDRPYRPRLSFREAIDEIRRNNKSQFDPRVVRSFVRVIHREVTGEVEHPSIIPLLQEHLEPAEVEGILDDLLR